MRIGFLTTQWPGARLGGIGAYTMHCAQALASAGHEAHVFTFTLPADVRRALPTGIVVHEVEDVAAGVQSGSLSGGLVAAIHAGGEGVYRLAQGALLVDAVRRVHGGTPLDVVEAPEYESLGLPLLMNSIIGLPVVTHLHSGSAIRRLANGEAQTADQRILEALEFAAILVGDGVCAPSAAVVEATRRVLPNDRIVDVIGLPFPVDMAATFGPPGLDGAFLYVGRLEKMKGMCVFAHAMNIFLGRCPGARVRLVGPDTATAPGGGSMAEWMREEMDEKVRFRLEFAGEKTAGELAEEYRQAAICIIPSLFESYSFVACEALAAGRGVIVSDGTGATEVVGNAGITFKNGDAKSLAEAMVKCAENPGLREDLGRKAFRRAREVLAVEATLPERIRFYESCISNANTKDYRRGLQRLDGLPGGCAGALAEGLTRLAGALAGVADPSHLTPGRRLLGIMNRVAAEAGRAGVEVFLYGAGRHSARLLAEKHVWEQAGHKVIGLIDDHPRFKEEAVAWGLPVESGEDFAVRGGPVGKGLAVVLSTDTFEEQFWKQTQKLRDKGVRVFKLYS